MSELEKGDNLRAYILLDVIEKGNSPLVTTLLTKSEVKSVHFDSRRGLIEAVIQAANREKLSKMADDVLTTAKRMSAGFRGILISGNGSGRSSQFLNHEPRLPYGQQ
jgi:hypothetical protein